jgi:hypothetical protein
MRNNVPAITPYQKVGFTFKSEKSSGNRKPGRLLPYHAKIMMRKD